MIRKRYFLITLDLVFGAMVLGYTVEGFSGQNIITVLWIIWDNYMHVFLNTMMV